VKGKVYWSGGGEVLFNAGGSENSVRLRTRGPRGERRQLGLLNKTGGVGHEWKGEKGTGGSRGELQGEYLYENGPF